MNENSEVPAKMHAAAVKVALYLSDLPRNDQLLVLTLHLKALAFCTKQSEQDMLTTIGQLLDSLREE